MNITVVKIFRNSEKQNTNTEVTPQLYSWGDDQTAVVVGVIEGRRVASA